MGTVELNLALQAISALQSPASTLEQRSNANLFLEQLKKGDVHVLLAVSSGLVSAGLAIEVQVVGYTMLTELVKTRWAELTAPEQAQTAQLAFNNVGLVCQQGAVGRPLKSKLAVLLAAVVRQQGVAAYNEVVPRLLQSAAEGSAQAEMACMVLHFLSEDLTQFDAVAGEQKRLFLSALTASVNVVFPFLCEALQSHFMAAVKCQEQQQAEEMQAHAKVISSALSALSTWVEWTPMPRITASNVVDACCFFLDAPDFRLLALEVLRQIVSRKRANERQEDYEVLMDKVAALLLASCAKQGLLVAGPLPPGLSKELDFEGSLEEFGKRLCTVLTTLGEAHYRCISTEERRVQLLQQMLVFTSHPFLLLSTITIPMWGTLLREAAAAAASPALNGGAQPQPAAAAAAPGAGGSDGGSAGGSAGGSRPNSPPPNFTPKSPPQPIRLPPECCQALIGVLSEMLSRVVMSAEAAEAAGAAGASSAGWPPYFDSHAEYKDFCNVTRGQVKLAMRAAAQLVPERGLTIAAQYVGAAVAAASDRSGALAQKAVRLEAAVHVVEALLPPLLDVSSQYPVVIDGLAALVQQVVAARVAEPQLMVLMARGFEAFAKLLNFRPDLAAAIINAAFETMMLIPLEAAGHLPPPARVTAAWRADFEARLGMANCIVKLAQAAPNAIIPYLEPLVAEIQKLWDRGLLREGERVLLWEGLLTASVAAGPVVQAQMLQHLLQPIAAIWTDPAWLAKLATPQTFVQAYLPVEQDASASAGPGPGSAALQQQQQQQRARIGSRAERWTLYHQLTLVERCIRRTAPPQPPQSPDTPTGPTSPRTSASALPAGGAAPQLAAPAAPGGAAAAQEHPLNGHVAWFMPPVAQMLTCMHALSAAEQQQMLGPLQGLTDMDPIEKAVRMGEDRDAAKEVTEPRCVAGDSLHDARYFLRGLRECANMVLSLVGQHCSAHWTNAALAASVVPAVTNNLQALDLGVIRLVLRHVMSVYCARCPPAARPLWTYPICRAIVPLMEATLASGWGAVAAGGAGAAAGGGIDGRVSGSGAAAGGAGKGGKASEEVVSEQLLREATREYVACLAILVRRPGGGAPGAPPATTGNGLAPLEIPNGEAGPLSPTGSDAGGSSVFEDLLRTDPSVAQSVVHTSVAALSWPDMETILKDVAVCRNISLLAASSVPALTDLVCTAMLQAAVLCLAQVYAINVQPDLLTLLRHIIVTFWARTPLTRATLQQLLQVPPEVLADFEQKLASTGSEKDQKGLIKQLVAQAAGEEVRKLLTAVSKIPVVSNMPEPQQKHRHVETEQDQHLQGAIYNAIFQGDG